MSEKDPVDLFHLLVTDQMLEIIVEQTNLYAEQFMESTTIPHRSRANLWGKQAHNLAEMKKFLSLVRIIHFPTTGSPHGRSPTTFCDILKRDRFTLILRFLHLNNNNGYIPKGQDGHDPLYKIRPFMDSLVCNFQGALYLKGSSH